MTHQSNEGKPVSNKEQLYRWVNASERLPEESQMIFIRNVESKHGGMIYKSDLVKMDNKQNVEWLEALPGDAEKDKEIENRILQLLQDSSIQDPASDSYEQRIIIDSDFENISNLISSKINEKIFHLNSLIEKAHEEGWKDYNFSSLTASWQRFKSENNI